MRMFQRGNPFMDVKAESGDFPVFSEAFLYGKVGKSDARFILGVAEEYEKLIRILGVEKIKELLEK